MKKLIIISILLITTNTHADELTTTYSVLHVIDWHQTLQIADSDDHYETNLILGKNPSKDQIHLYFFTTLLGQYWLMENIKHRQIYQIFWIGIQAKTIENNVKLGFKLNF